jgi:hypothetical protein
MELGQFYRSGAIAGGRPEDQPACVHPRLTRGHPGSRVPHVALANGRSTIDSVADGFALFTGPASGAWIERAADACRELGSTLQQTVLPAEVVGRFGIGSSGAVLGRPDGFVAWRAADDAQASPETVRAALATALMT